MKSVYRCLMVSANKYKLRLLGLCGVAFILSHTLLHPYTPAAPPKNDLEAEDEPLFPVQEKLSYDLNDLEVNLKGLNQSSVSRAAKVSHDKPFQAPKNTVPLVPDIPAPLLKVPENAHVSTSEENKVAEPSIETRTSLALANEVSAVSGVVDLTSEGNKIKPFIMKIDSGTTKEPLGNFGFLSSLFKDKDSVVNIKPFLNFTAQLLGIETTLPDTDINQLDPQDPATVFKSIFQVWNPKASNWALKTSRRFKEQIRRSGEHGSTFTSPSSQQKIRVPMSNCNCTREVVTGLPRVGTLSNSTCSQDTFLRGPGQKVVGFSFYGNPQSAKSKQRKYFKGIQENLALLSEFYPGWIMRVYYDLEPGSPLHADLCALACDNPSLDICYVKHLPSSADISKVFAMIWRFFPILDPQVDLYVSRDLDSRISKREAAAVAEWMASTHHFHFMRDHPAHSIEVLGSGWGVSLGANNSTVRSLMTESFKEASTDPLFWAPRNSYGPDQGFLKRYLWPWGKWSAMSHDSYTCKRFPRTSPFPTQRENVENNFVASVAEVKDVMKQECPEACRPKNHKDWKLC